MRRCGKCGQDKGAGEFHRGSSWCKPCKNEASRNWNSAHPERHRETCKGKHKLKQTLRQYGLSEDDYMEMVKQQNAVCAICGETNGTKRLFVDHDHATGRVRGLLCSPCNTALGHAKDSPARLRAAAEYLERFASVEEVAELVTP